MRKLIVFTAIILLPIAKIAAQYVMQTRPLITVTATASVKANPDIVVYHLRYTIELKSGSELLGQPTYENMFSFVPVSDLEVKWGPEEYISSNRVSRKVAITLKNFAKHRDLLRELIKIPNLSIERLEFRVSKLAELRSDARLSAIEQAQFNAQKIAQKLGQTLGKAFSVADIPSPIIDFSETTEQGSQPQSQTIPQSLVIDSYIEFPGYITVTAKVEASFELN